MNKNQQLRMWLKGKSKRGNALARQMGVSKQYIHQVSIKDTGISDNKWAEFKAAMACVEKMERRMSEEKILIIALTILGSTMLITNASMVIWGK